MTIIEWFIFFWRMCKYLYQFIICKCRPSFWNIIKFIYKFAGIILYISISFRFLKKFSNHLQVIIDCSCTQ